MEFIALCVVSSVLIVVAYIIGYSKGTLATHRKQSSSDKMDVTVAALAVEHSYRQGYIDGYEKRDSQINDSPLNELPRMGLN